MKDGRGDIDSDEEAAIQIAVDRKHTQVPQLEDKFSRMGNNEEDKKSKGLKSTVTSEFMGSTRHNNNINDEGGGLQSHLSLSIPTELPSSLSHLPHAFITSLANVPVGAKVGDLLVAHSKVVAENQYLNALVESLRVRESRALQSLRACERTLMDCVRSAETEALRLAERRAPAIVSGAHHAEEQRLRLGSSTASNPPSPLTVVQVYNNTKNAPTTSDVVRVKELERQTRALVDLLNKIEVQTLAGSAPNNNNSNNSGSSSKRNISAEIDAAAAARERDLLDRLAAALELAGDVNENDLLLELQYLRSSNGSGLPPRPVAASPKVEKKARKVMSAQPTAGAELTPAPSAGAALARAANTASASFDPAAEAGSMVPSPSTVERRSSSQSPPYISAASASGVTNNPEPGFNSKPSLERKASFREQPVTVVLDIRPEKVASPPLKIKNIRSRSRQHTVTHSSASKAMETFSRTYHSMDDPEGDIVEAEGEADDEAGSGSPGGDKGEANSDLEKNNPAFKLIVHATKSYEDPCGDFLRFVMTASFTGTETSDGMKIFRYRAYDQDTLRELEMDVDENVLRASLRDNVSNFTYDEMEKRFHEEVLKRLKLIPGHDLNNDGFLNEEDCRRDDLTFALVAPGMWKPLGVMVEVGPRARKKSMERERALASSGAAGHGRATSVDGPTSAFDLLKTGALSMSTGASFNSGGGDAGREDRKTGRSLEKWLHQETAEAEGYVDDFDK